MTAEVVAFPQNIIMSRATLYSKAFVEASRKVFQHKGYRNAGLLRHLAKLEKMFVEELTKSEDARRNKAEELAQKDEFGNAIIENENFVFTDEGRKAWDEEYKRFMAEMISFDAKQVNLNYLLECDLSPSDINILAPILATPKEDSV